MSLDLDTVYYGAGNGRLIVRAVNGTHVTGESLITGERFSMPRDEFDTWASAKPAEPSFYELEKQREAAFVAAAFARALGGGV